MALGEAGAAALVRARLAHLARLLGMPNGDGHYALIKVSLVWAWQTEHYTPEAPCFVVPVGLTVGEALIDARVWPARSHVVESHDDRPDRGRWFQAMAGAGGILLGRERGDRSGMWTEWAPVDGVHCGDLLASCRLVPYDEIERKPSSRGPIPGARQGGGE